MDKSDVLQFIQRSRHKNANEIDLSNKGITELPEELGDLTTLKTLNLSYNNISILPASIIKLVNLKSLFLTRNKISKLPIGISNLDKLELLDVSYNPLLKIPREIGSFTQLKLLDASYCELQSLPLDLTKLYNLKNLTLEDNPLEFPPQKVIKRGLYAIMHFLSIEKRKKEALKVMLQVFNLPEKIHAPFRQYIKYFNQMMTEANQKEVVFDLNFINQDFYQEMDLNAGVEGYLYDIMRYIQEKVDTIKSTEEVNSEIKDVYFESRINDIKARLNRFNDSLDDKIDEIKKMKNELNGLSESLDVDVP
ncbi:MAG: leucine-rich repeat domain-containing protein [Salinivirgaceae bacterium]|jgi:5'-deoxynucleotidase YfbR-like HD superfamily hydrolase|nr:leucine-rich repeat domain-containing protein [Salinivirgaceae bacterium]